MVEYLGRMAVGAYKPIVTLQMPPAVAANYLFSALAIVMLALSLRPRKPAA
jgi:hypothetical protein